MKTFKEFTEEKNMKTLYIQRKVTNGQDIVDWAKSQGFDKTLEPSDMHVTQCFSKAEVDWNAVPKSKLKTISLSNDKNRVVAPLGDEGAVVLKIANPKMEERFQELMAAGTSYDYEKYMPHISISYFAKGIDISKVKAYDGNIELGPEIWAELDLDWKHKITEK